MRKILLLFVLQLNISGMTVDGIYAKPLLTSISLLAPQHDYFNAYVVVPVRATEIERYAADELAKYIKKITGVEISVVTEKPDFEYFGFYIGQTVKGSHYTPQKISQFEGANGFRIKSILNRLVIVGGDDLGTLYGVYAFLEEYQGCGWFMPYQLGEVVPHNEGIFIPENIDVTEVPDIPIRWMGNGDWALKNRMNTGIQINGHDVGVINKWIYHTYDRLVPNDRYFEDHPEYFSLRNAKRIYGGWGSGQLCTSNPEVIKLVTEHLVENLERDPDIKFISLTPNDCAGYCGCELCKAQIEPERMNDRHGIGTSRIHTFNNEVARRVKKYCPTQYIKSGAYAGYLRYPLDASYEPEDNLAIMITPHIFLCHNHSINDTLCSKNVDFMGEFRKWSKKSRHLHVFAYETLWGWANLPWPMVHVLKKDMPEYHRQRLELFYTQTMSHTQSYALNYYVAAKLAWNTSLDIDSLIKTLKLH